MIETVKITAVKSNPKNPRLIKNDKFKQLVKSIKDFPEMLSIRPIVVNKDMMVLGGNMRLKACIEAGLKEVAIIKASELTPEQQNEFIIKDNVGFGEWEWDAIANDWDSEQLAEWGLDIPQFSQNVADVDRELPETNKVHFLITTEIKNFEGVQQEISKIISQYENTTFLIQESSTY